MDLGRILSGAGAAARGYGEARTENLNQAAALEQLRRYRMEREEQERQIADRATLRAGLSGVASTIGGLQQYYTARPVSDTAPAPAPAAAPAPPAPTTATPATPAPAAPTRSAPTPAPAPAPTPAAPAPTRAAPAPAPRAGQVASPEQERMEAEYQDYRRRRIEVELAGGPRRGQRSVNASAAAVREIEQRYPEFRERYDAGVSARTGPQGPALSREQMGIYRDYVQLLQDPAFNLREIRQIEQRHPWVIERARNEATGVVDAAGTILPTTPPAPAPAATSAATPAATPAPEPATPSGGLRAAVVNPAALVSGQVDAPTVLRTMQELNPGRQITRIEEQYGTLKQLLDVYIRSGREEQAIQVMETMLGLQIQYDMAVGLDGISRLQAGDPRVIESFLADQTGVLTDINPVLNAQGQWTRSYQVSQGGTIIEENIPADDLSTFIRTQFDSVFQREQREAAAAFAEAQLRYQQDVSLAYVEGDIRAQLNMQQGDIDYSIAELEAARDNRQIEIIQSGDLTFVRAGDRVFQVVSTTVDVPTGGRGIFGGAITEQEERLVLRPVTISSSGT